MEEKEFLEYLFNLKHLYLYGAGVVGKRVLNYCINKGVKVDGFIVTNLQGNLPEVLGYPVLQLSDVLEKGDMVHKMDVIVCLNSANGNPTSNINDDLFDIDFNSRFVLTKSINKWLIEWEKNEIKSNSFNKLTELEIDRNNDNVEMGHCILMEKNGEVLCRCEVRELLQNYSVINEICNRKELTSIYGEVPVLNYSDNISYKQMDYYVALCHVDKSDVSDLNESGIHFLQVGAALTDIRKGCQTDDEGDNISEKNRDYSETTGLYWIWKNTKGQNYIAFNHYRRRLLLDNESFSYIKKNDIDVVTALPHFTVRKIKDFFVTLVSKSDWRLLSDTIIKNYPHLEKQWEEYENYHFYFHANLALWKREWFDRYCEFVFSITEEIDQYYRQKNVIRMDRYMGYLIENLTSFFLYAHRDELRLACTEMKWIQ